MNSLYIPLEEVRKMMIEIRKNYSYTADRGGDEARNIVKSEIRTIEELKKRLSTNK